MCKVRSNFLLSEILTIYVCAWDNTGTTACFNPASDLAFHFLVLSFLLYCLQKLSNDSCILYPLKDLGQACVSVENLGERKYRQT